MRTAPSNAVDRAWAVPTPSPAGPSRLPALAAVATAAFSIIYAVAYLVVTPAAQRGDDVDASLRSLVADPLGMRIAAGCLVAAGLSSGLALLALRARMRQPQIGRAHV